MSEFRLWSRNFVAACVAQFFYFGSFYLLIPTLPQYVAGLGGTLSQVGVVMGLFTLAAVVLRPSFGRLGDRYGRKIFMATGAGLFILFPLLYASLAGIGPLYLARIGHGLAHACYLAASSAYIADLAPTHRRGEVIGIYSTANIVAMALFPAWGASIVQGHTFFFLFVVSALTAAAGWVATLVLRDIRAARPAGPAPTTLAIARRPTVLIPSLALFSAATSYGAVVTFLPVFAPARGIANFGLFFTVYAVSTILSRIVAGAASDRLGRKRVIVPFMAILAVTVFLLPSAHTLKFLLALAVLLGISFGSFMPTLNALVVDLTPPAERGAALGFFTAFMDVGITAGSMVLGPIGNRFGYPAMFYTAAILVVLGLVYFALAMPADRPPFGQAAQPALQPRDGSGT